MTKNFSIFFWIQIWGIFAWGTENVKAFRSGFFETTFQSNYFRTDSNHKDFNNSNSLNAGYYYQLLDNTLATRYLYSDNGSFFGGGNFAYGESKGLGGMRTGGMVNQVYLGTEYKFYEGSFNIIGEASTLIPLEKIEPSTNDIITSEGVVQNIFKLTIQKRFGHSIYFFNLGYNGRNNGRSDLMLWGLGSETSFTGGLLGWAFSGYQSISHDDDTDSTKARETTLLRANAGSEKFYSVNPSLMEFSGYGKFYVSDYWMVKVGGSKTLFGNHIANGFDIFLGVTYYYDFGGWYQKATSKKNSSYIETPISSEKKVPWFREDTKDGIDQRLFRPKPTRPGAPNQYNPQPPEPDDEGFQRNNETPGDSSSQGENSNSSHYQSTPVTNDEINGNAASSPTKSGASDVQIKLRKKRKGE